MTENTNNTEKCILAAVDTGEYDVDASLDELEELVRSDEAEAVGRVTQKRPAYDTATCMGSGRLAELCASAEQLEADLIVFDCELTATQVRNIENITKVRVIDRTTLILDIFARRAVSSEGRLQVELAQQRYRLPRLAGMGVSLSRLGGGIGTRGPGESQLETDKRHIRRRISALESQLEEIVLRRERMRRRRKKDEVLTAAIVGYTNVGKSTLLNALTDAGVIAENKLFATLDLTSRSIELPDGRSVMLVDTVGLIRRLPHHLVEAFKSTLEEAANADILLNIIDISAPDAYEQAEVTQKLLAELGCEGIPVINVLNKCDKTDFADSIPCDSTTVKISAKQRTGFDMLVRCIMENLPQTSKRMKLLIPYDRQQLIAQIRVDGRINREEYVSEGTLIDATVDIKLISTMDKYTTDMEFTADENDG